MGTRVSEYCPLVAVDDTGFDRPHLIDALYRMTVHAHTITEAWYHALLANGVHPQAYVELCGIVTSITSVCSFARTIGASLPPFAATVDTRPTSRPATGCLS